MTDPLLSENPDDKERINNYIDRYSKNQINKLREYVAIRSVSGSLDHRDYCHEMLEHCANDFRLFLQADMKIVTNPHKIQYSEDGDELEYPGIILGSYPRVPDKKKKTILIYGHLDVMPAHKDDGWDTDPWTLTEKDGKLYGRGSSDDKGPILGWLFALITLKQLKIKLPINLKFCFEAMEESHSIGLKECITQDNKSFFENIDGTIISDNYWLGTDKPCVTYGLRGACSFYIASEGAAKDVHSGLYGGAIYEPMDDVIDIMSKLKEKSGHILIPGIYEDLDFDVTNVSEEQLQRLQDVDFDPEEWAHQERLNLVHPDKVETLIRRWHYPSLSLHGIEGAHYGPGDKTVIPRKVIGKFTIRLAMGMDPEKTKNQTVKYLETLIAEIEQQTTNRVWVDKAEAIGRPWKANIDNYLYSSARKAINTVYQVEPDFTCEGCSIPVTIDFEDATKSPVILLPMGAGDDGAHGQNEKLDKRNYLQGTKVFANFLLNL